MDDLGNARGEALEDRPGGHAKRARSPWPRTHIPPCGRGERLLEDAGIDRSVNGAPACESVVPFREERVHPLLPHLDERSQPFTVSSLPLGLRAWKPSA